MVKYFIPCLENDNISIRGISMIVFHRITTKSKIFPFIPLLRKLLGYIIILLKQRANGL